MCLRSICVYDYVFWICIKIAHYFTICSPKYGFPRLSPFSGHPFHKFQGCILKDDHRIVESPPKINDWWSGKYSELIIRSQVENKPLQSRMLMLHNPSWLPQTILYWEALHPGHTYRPKHHEHMEIKEPSKPTKKPMPTLAKLTHPHSPLLKPSHETFHELNT